MKKVKTLLELAKNVPVSRSRHLNNLEEKIELAIAYMKSEITITQIAKARGLKSAANSGYTIAVCLREAYHRGLISVKGEK